MRLIRPRKVYVKPYDTASTQFDDDGKRVFNAHAHSTGFWIRGQWNELGGEDLKNLGYGADVSRLVEMTVKRSDVSANSWIPRVRDLVSNDGLADCQLFVEKAMLTAEIGRNGLPTAYVITLISRLEAGA